MHHNQSEAAADLVNELLKEKKRDRRWRNFRFICWFLLILFAILNIMHLFHQKPSAMVETKYAALIRLEGMIAPGRDFSAETLLPTLEDAFKDKNSLGVILDINSPGGTPVQAAIIHDAILKLKQKYHKKIIVVGEDLLTSGAYYVAVAADKIYVNPNTLTGSIGVIMKGFGFVDAINKLGIERRVYAAGSNKDRLDPFLPKNPEDQKKIDEVIGEVHQNFVNAVTNGRKNKLQGDPKDLFSGDFWSGQTAIKLGLVDQLGNLSDVLEIEFKTSHYEEFGESNNLLKLLSGKLTSAFDSLFYLRF